MKRRVEWVLILFTVCFIFVIRFGLLEGSSSYLNIDLLTRSSVNNISSYLPQLRQEGGHYILQKPEVFNGGVGSPGSSLFREIAALERSETLVTPKSFTTASILGSWGGLKRVFNRSDLAVDMIEGFKEGSVAWKGLKKLLEKEKLKEGQPGGTEKPQLCQYSVSSTNATDLADVRELPIHCGMVLDSSVSVIATIPIGAAEFQFDLIGAKTAGSSPPVILHYNVRMQGDKVTQNPVIIENTWTSAVEWEEEQRCPSSEDGSGRQVDGLDVCAEQVGKVLPLNPAGVNASESRWSNILEEPVDKKKPWFPFVEGLPFAATIWVGWDGFHMTVNGRHVSSFEYRNNLEPWLVNKLAIKGNVEVSSVIATGLPVSENGQNMQAVPDLETLKAPPLLLRNETLIMFIGVFSSSNNFDRRMAIRRSWMQSKEVRSGEVAVRFFVGLHKQDQVNKELWDEAKTYGDIQILPFVDYYHLITLKTIAICIYATKHIKAEYVMKTDDDTFVRVDAILSAILKRESPRSKNLLLGEVEKDNAPERDQTSKWYISREEWLADTYPPWAHGPGYIISKDIARFVALSSGKEQLKMFKLEDVAMGMWVDEYRRTERQSIDYVHNDKFTSGGCQEDYIIAHYQNPKQMLCLWLQLKSTGAPTCCA